MVEEQLRVLEALGDGTMSRRLSDVAETLQLPLKEVRSCARELVAMGLAEYTFLVLEDEGKLAGWGYWRNDAGNRALDAAFPVLSIL
jgi:hypothetical protein